MADDGIPSAKGRTQHRGDCITDLAERKMELGESERGTVKGSERMKTLKELNDQKKWLKERVDDEIDRAFRFGAESERIKLMDEFGRKDRTTRFDRATERDRDVHGENLAGWCTECGAPIEGRWVFGINFCPYCGRKIDWELSRDGNGGVKYHSEVEE